MSTACAIGPKWSAWRLLSDDAENKQGKIHN
jgi:hypothetical protein